MPKASVFFASKMVLEEKKIKAQTGWGTVSLFRLFSPLTKNLELFVKNPTIQTRLGKTVFFTGAYFIKQLINYA